MPEVAVRCVSSSLSVMAFKEKSVNRTNNLSSAAYPLNHREITRCLEDTALEFYIEK